MGDYDCDVLVVGSGAGGAAFAQACASTGKRVLVIERGRRPDTSEHRSERAALIDKQPYDDRTIRVNNRLLRLYMGGVVGGGTSVFGAVMLRPSRDDFAPGRHYADRLPRALWEWPVDYDQLAPYYDAAETLWGVARGQADDYRPLEPPRHSPGAEALPLAPINERVRRTARARGLRPFQLPLAIDRSACRLCDHCAGFLCPFGARRSAADILHAAADRGDLQLWEQVEVERLVAGRRGEVAAAVVVQRASGRRLTIRAQRYVLAAGAVGSPAILLKSGMGGPHVGRNYMLHYSPIAIGMFRSATEADRRFVKQLGFADFYFGTRGCPRKMGLVQSLPAPGPLMLAKSGLARLPQSTLTALRRRMLPLAGIVEDLPNPANRVFLDGRGAIGVAHAFSPFDRQRGRALGRAMQRILRDAGAVACVARAMPSMEHVAHQCGTLRFGNASALAPVDRDGRLRGHENLFVADGSVLPTSLGVGPSLTIVALALRSAAIALQEI